MVRLLIREPATSDMVMPLQIMPVTAPFHEVVFDVATSVFAADSSLHHVLDISVREYRSYLRVPFMAMLAQGLSLMVVDTAQDQVAAVVVGMDICSEIPSSPSDHADKLAPVSALSAQLTAQYRAHRQPQLGQSALLDMAAVLPTHRGMGLYAKLRRAFADHARVRGFEYVVGELSSPATQHVVVTQLGHDVVAKTAFAEFTHAGQCPFQSITTPSHILLTEGRL